MTEKLLPKPSPNNKTVNEYVRAVEHGLKAQHVMAFPGGWVIRTMGRVGASQVFSTEKEAVAEAKKRATTKGADVFVHGRDGKIRKRI